MFAILGSLFLINETVSQPTNLAEKSVHRNWRMCLRLSPITSLLVLIDTCALAGVSVPLE